MSLYTTELEQLSRIVIGPTRGEKRLTSGLRLASRRTWRPRGPCRGACAVSDVCAVTRAGPDDAVPGAVPGALLV